MKTFIIIKQKNARDCYDFWEWSSKSKRVLIKTKKNLQKKHEVVTGEEEQEKKKNIWRK